MSLSFTNSIKISKYHFALCRIKIINDLYFLRKFSLCSYKISSHQITIFIKTAFPNFYKYSYYYICSTDAFNLILTMVSCKFITIRRNIRSIRISKEQYLSIIIIISKLLTVTNKVSNMLKSSVISLLLCWCT